MLATGFVALSDDAFSRVVIAERFVAHPTLDPSGTSWLPLPFLVTGAFMSGFGRSLGVARALAVALGVAAALLVHRAARASGASPEGAFFGALVASVTPTAARLGVSFQPEAITAALVVFGALATRVDGPTRVAGAFALGAATLCRYDAWPAAAAFAALALLDAFRDASSRRAGRAASALIAIVPAAAWIVHGAVSHGDAFFFLHRVTAYRRALGDHEALTAALLAYPIAFFRAEPELSIAGTVVVAAAFVSDRKALRAWKRPALVFSAILGFLLLGRIMDGAPTHHDERLLLPLWTGLALVASESLVLAAKSARVAKLAAPTAVACVVGFVIRSEVPADSLAPRGPERAIGAEAHRLLPAADRLLVDTPDYGYFAVIAAFGAPERAAPFDDRDPRHARAANPFVDAMTLRARLSASDATWFVAARPHDGVASEIADVVATDAGFGLFRVRALR